MPNYPRRTIALGPPYDDGTLPLNDDERSLSEMAYAVLNRNDAGTHERNLALEVLRALRPHDDSVLVLRSRLSAAALRSEAGPEEPDR